MHQYRHMSRCASRDKVNAHSIYYANLGWYKLLTGAIEKAIPTMEQALRLSPRDGRAGN